MININSEETKKITKITAQKRAGRYNVFLDGEYAFPISEETFIHFRLGKGMAVNGTLLKEIGEYETNAEAYNIALTYITGQLRTENEVRQKLRQQDYEESVIEAVIAKLADLNLLDDREYAKSYVRTMMRTGDKGPRYLINHLRQKGVLENDLQAGLQLFSDTKQVALATRVGQKLQKRHQAQALRQQQLKIRQNLMQKGFTSEIIEKALAEIEFTVDSDAEYEKLRKLGERLLRRYQGQPEYQRTTKIKRSLYQKGFEMELIERFLNENDS
ncbi:recombination regulator RecX [Pediococcus acidilactici]|uniref:recombination regulator RecX n=1 Tax=Pediococcus acidilactici TaxID=1254 RepID=UPI000FF8601C|nr:recombination regulator RecX [Pediococcus acidilactici]RWY86571.1 recombination regulator RecX [Pediococcus acidilactici]